MTGSYLTPLGQQGQAAAAVAADMEMGSLYSGAGGEAHLPDDFNAFDMNSVVGSVGQRSVEEMVHYESNNPSGYEDDD